VGAIAQKLSAHTDKLIIENASNDLCGWMCFGRSSPSAMAKPWKPPTIHTGVVPEIVIRIHGVQDSD